MLSGLISVVLLLACSVGLLVLFLYSFFYAAPRAVRMAELSDRAQHKQDTAANSARATAAPTAPAPLAAAPTADAPNNGAPLTQAQLQQLAQYLANTNANANAPQSAQPQQQLRQRNAPAPAASPRSDDS